ncbi:MAG TPA: hypothetical protein VGN36_02360, partial [Sphingorhabdus sp.]|nr:hypothetical protein [Sphingorhabdus sp.]
MEAHSNQLAPAEGELGNFPAIESFKAVSDRIIGRIKHRQIAGAVCAQPVSNASDIIRGRLLDTNSRRQSLAQPVRKLEPRSDAIDDVHFCREQCQQSGGQRYGLSVAAFAFNQFYKAIDC